MIAYFGLTFIFVAIAVVVLFFFAAVWAISFRKVAKIAKESMAAIKKSKRPKCPFYGFSLAGMPNIVLMDSEGNQCALITSAFAPCRMEMELKSPGWENCRFSKREYENVIQTITDNGKVFPRELRPKDKSEWSGISLKDWIKYVMEQ